MQEEPQASGRITLSMPASRRAEFDAALLKLKQRRPFDSISKIVADAVISAANTLGDDTMSSEEAVQLKRDIQEEFPQFTATPRIYQGATGWVVIVEDPSTKKQIGIKSTDENWRETIAQGLSSS